MLVLQAWLLTVIARDDTGTPDRDTDRRRRNRISAIRSRLWRRWRPM